jgi:acetoin utilization protein AcuB
VSKIIIDEFMTAQTHSIRFDEKLHTAEELMEKYSVRHLPVLEGGHLVGLISDRDIKKALAKNVDPKTTTIHDYYSFDVYVVAPGTPLQEVAQTMFEKRYGSAVVAVEDKVKGIFTTTDACKALAQVLEG